MAIDVSTFRPLRDQVFVADLESGMTITHGGLIIPDDNRTNRGIRNRWARVYAVGPDVEDIQVGEWVLIEHGRWTNGIDFEENGKAMKLWRIDWPDAVILAGDENPSDRTTMKFD
jgi:co-chaperonin GroES (HSP10)